MTLSVDVQGHIFRWHDNGVPFSGAVCSPDGTVIGNVKEEDLWRADNDAERSRSLKAIEGRVRAVALAWLGGRGCERRQRGRLK